MDLDDLEPDPEEIERQSRMRARLMAALRNDVLEYESDLAIELEKETENIRSIAILLFWSSVIRAFIHQTEILGVCAPLPRVTVSPMLAGFINFPVPEWTPIIEVAGLGKAITVEISPR